MDPSQPLPVEPALPNDDVDLVLRHVSRLFPEQFARALLPPGSDVVAAAWLDTQVASRQRRLDRALDVRTAAGERRLLHNEWQLRMESDVPFRVFEYHVLLALSLMDELIEAKADAGEANIHQPPGTRVEQTFAVKPRGSMEMMLPPIESTVVLLSGREEPWPEQGEFRTSPSDGLFSGVSYRIEPVYQRTVADLAARGSRLWMIFAPLAVDATPARMGEVVEKLRRESTPREFEELSVALTVMADADKRRRGLREKIVSLLPEEIIMESWVYKQGIEKGIERGLRPLERLLERRLGRPITEEERARVTERFDTVGADRLGDVALDLAPEALAAWLNDPNAT
ncbi:MAG TPA: hypothetical protein VLS89_20525 [Candidatus Nanopelagicales bacterium]|nr:hypothetical protein [Candidatus Nanopelagicales bacterium]